MRPVLTGVLVSASGGEMTMVATDSYRLAVKTTGLKAVFGHASGQSFEVTSYGWSYSNLRIAIAE